MRFTGAAALLLAALLATAQAAQYVRPDALAAECVKLEQGAAPAGATLYPSQFHLKGDEQVDDEFFTQASAPLGMGGRRRRCSRPLPLPDRAKSPLAGRYVGVDAIPLCSLPLESSSQPWQRHRSCQRLQQTAGGEAAAQAQTNRSHQRLSTSSVCFCLFSVPCRSTPPVASTSSTIPLIRCVI